MFRRALIFSIATFLIAFSARSVAQVLPSAKQSVLPFEIAGGLLSFHSDIGSGYMRGYTIWGDYSPAFLTNRVHGLAIEAQLKNIAFNRSTSQTNVTEKTFLGGANYSWHRYRNFYPMASAKVGYGSLDFLLNNDYSYTHDSREVFSFSGAGSIVFGRMSGRTRITNINTGRSSSAETSTPGDLPLASHIISGFRIGGMDCALNRSGGGQLLQCQIHGC